MRRVPQRWGCFVLLGFLLVPALVVAYLLHSAWWIIVVPLALVVLMCVVAAFGGKRRVTPQTWADELEEHLLGTGGPYHWDDITSVTLADERLESLRQRRILDFDTLDTPEKRQALRQIIEALRRGEIP